MKKRVQPKTTLTCQGEDCGISFQRNLWDHNKAVKLGQTRFFCSHSCSAKNSNKKRTRVKKRNPCDRCGEPTDKYKRKFCSPCLAIVRKEAEDLINKRSLRELKLEYNTLAYHAKIRGLARSVYNSSGSPWECFICGYNKHVDICHIKAIADFCLDSTLGEVNSRDNLVALCKNHHWEFDNDALDQKDKSLIFAL